MNARASTGVNVIMWLAGIGAIMIVSIWFMRNNPFEYLSAANALEEDMRQISYRLNNACNIQDYYAKYNPVNEVGYIEIKDDLCISLTDDIGKTGSRSLRRCQPLNCKVRDAVLNLGNSTYIVITKRQNVTVTQE